MAEERPRLPKRVIIWVNAINYANHRKVRGLEKTHNKAMNADVDMTWIEFFREKFNVEVDPLKHFVKKTGNRTPNKKHSVNEQISVWLSGFKTTLHQYVVQLGETKIWGKKKLKGTLKRKTIKTGTGTTSTASRIITRPVKFSPLGVNSNEPRLVVEIDRVTAQAAMTSAANHVKKVGGGPLSSTFSTAPAPLSTTSHQANRIPVERQVARRTCPSTFAVPLPSGSNGIVTHGYENNNSVSSVNGRMSIDNRQDIDESPDNSDDAAGQEEERVQENKFTNESSGPKDNFKAVFVNNAILKFRNSQLIKARDALRKLKQSGDKQSWTNYGMACPEAFIIVQSLFDI